MGLAQQRPAAVTEALDDVDLPQRVPPIHRPADDAGDLLRQLVGRPGGSEPDLTDVIVEIEVGVVDPVRVVQPERHVDNPAAERLDVADQRAEPLVDGPVGVEFGVRPLVDAQPVDVPIGRRCLHVEECGVEAAQLFHHHTSWNPCGSTVAQPILPDVGPFRPFEAAKVPVVASIERVEGRPDAPI